MQRRYYSLTFMVNPKDVATYSAPQDSGGLTGHLSWPGFHNGTIYRRHGKGVDKRDMLAESKYKNIAEKMATRFRLTKTYSSCDAEGGTRGLLESSHDPENSNFLENNPKRRWTKRFNNVRENPSSNEEYVHEQPDLSNLKPPSRSDGFSTGEEDLEALKTGSLVLISNIKEAADANEMIGKSSKAFTFFDFIGVDYTPVYKAVRSVIRYQCYKEALAKQKPHPAFDTKATHNQAASEFSKAEERRTEVNREVEDAQHERGANAAHLKRLYDQVMKTEEEKAKVQANVAAARADKVICDEAYSKAKSNLEKIALERSEARKAIDDYERRCQETNNGLNRAMEELWSLRSSLQ
ncbi:hypothetical protein L1987_56256 [Smallanthus sonchifolius]|uniref:Uncharacterized protein n=1 Tax=Smallanthus sonchifolius TaxID=185202 RepID=A0ACB9ECD0_9ASTR|nr:hypothetical protein L1987_56256 [Smallanthus sonchifolius]